MNRTVLSRVVLALAVCLVSAPAFATCKSEAAEKKLGAPPSRAS